MTASSSIRSAWTTKIWGYPDIVAMTPNIFMYEVLADSQFTVANLYHEAEIRFFTCKVQRRSEPLPVNQTRYTFSVTIEYYRQQTDVAESVYNDVQDHLETMDDLVRSQLGKTWNTTVDYYQGAQPIRIDSVRIDGKDCWRGGYVYTAFKTS